MKKLTAILMAFLILAMSMFSVNVFAQESESEEQIDVSQTRLAKWNDMMNETKEIDYIVTMTEDNGNKKVSRFRRYGDNVLIESTLNGTEFKMVENKEGKFIYFPKIPFLYFKFDKYFEESFLFVYGIPDNLVFVKAYEESGYYVEEFYNINTDVTCRYYFIGDELKLEKSSGNSTTEYISREVNENEIKLPDFCINATILLPLFLIFLV